MYLWQAMAPTSAQADQILLLVGLGVFLYLAYQTLAKKKIGKNFYFGMTALAIYGLFAVLSMLQIPVEQFGWLGTVLYWIVHIAFVAFLLPYIGNAVLAFVAFLVGKLTGEEYLA